MSFPDNASIATKVIGSRQYSPSCRSLSKLFKINRLDNVTVDTELVTLDYVALLACVMK